MKHSNYRRMMMSIFLTTSCFISILYAQTNAINTSYTGLLRKHNFIALNTITNNIQAKSYIDIDCPQLDVEHAKKLAEAIEQVLITLEKYKAWIKEGLRSSGNDTQWLEAQEIVDKAYIRIITTQRGFYRSVNKYLLPQSYKADPGPSFTSALPAINYLNTRFAEQINTLDQLQSRFDIRSYSSNPSLKLPGTNFKPGEEITIEFISLPCYDEDAWIGIIPSETEHGNKIENQQYKISYKHLGKKTKGSLQFIAPDKPGSYDFRMINAEDNGNEVASVTFKIVAEPETVKYKYLIAVDKLKYLPGENMTLRAMIPANVPARHFQFTLVSSGSIWSGIPIAFDITAFQQYRPAMMKVPQVAGDYEIHLFERGVLTGRSMRFKVTAPPVAADLVGLWEASGYGCEGKTNLTEIIQIYLKGDKLVAVKVTGDNCVPRGEVTWEGTLNGNTITGRGHVGYPGGPLSWINTSLKVIDKDNIQGSPVGGRMKRKSSE